MKTRQYLLARVAICTSLLFSFTSFPLTVFANNNVSVQVVCKGVPVAGVQVELIPKNPNKPGYKFSTDKKGRVQFHNFADGVYDIVVTCGTATFKWEIFTGAGLAAFAHDYLFSCCPTPPGAPEPNPDDGLIAIDGKSVTSDVTASSRASVRTEVAAANGLRSVKFDTINGRVIVNLPDDMMAGDTISGTVVAEPKGQTPGDQAKNLSVLTGCVIEVETPKKPDGTSNPKVTAQVTAALSTITFTLPPLPAPPRTNVSSASSGDVGIRLRNTSGSFTVGGTAKVSVELISLSLQSVAPFQVPTIGQQGRPIEIIGPFDGNNANTTLMYGPARSSIQDFEKNTENVSGGFGLIKPIAESPRKCVFESPPNVTGPMEIMVKEGNSVNTGTYRNVGVNLTAPKTNLMKGESTTLTVQVTGLQGIKDPVPLTLDSKGVITMEGGMYQPLVIQPSQVGADGRYTTTRGITGVQAGGWTSTATVVTQPFNIVLRDPDPPQTMLVNSFTGAYVFCGSGPKVNGTGQIKRQGCIITLTDDRPDRMVQGTLNDCTPVDNGRFFIFHTAGTNTDIRVTVTATQPPRARIYFNPLSKPAPPVQDVSAFATCP